MIKIGITGIIGSGKSEVSRIFEILGVPVYYADDMAKRLLVTDKTIKKELIKKYGNDIYIKNSINRNKLAEIIFNSEDERHFVNRLVHPVVISDYQLWIYNTGKKLTAIESALVFDSDLYNHLDKIIHVKASHELRVQRIINRDNISLNEAEKKINLQTKDEVFDNRSDFIIINDENNSLLLQTLEILEILQKTA